MPWPDVDRFLDQVCTHIKYKGAHSSIREELQNHIQDRMDDYMDSGIPEEEAIQKAVEAMGNPVHIGKNLNTLHKPYLGWILSIINLLIVLVGSYLVIILVFSLFSNFEPFGSMPSGKDIKYSVNLNEKDRIDDRTVVIKKLVVDKNHNVYIRFDDYSKPFSIGWSMINFEVFDDIGNKYYGGEESRGNLFGTKHLIRIDNFNENSGKIILNYDYYNRKMRFELPLSGGDSL